MEKVSSLEQLMTLSAGIRAQRKGYITNFYPDPQKHRVWIEKGDCLVEKQGDTLFVIRQDTDFWNVFYCSTTLEQLGKDIAVFADANDGQTMMADVVGRDEQCQAVVAMLQGHGFTEATSLVRMTRMTEDMLYVADERVRKAEKAEMEKVNNLLHTYFDAKTEQIPYMEELLSYQEQGHVLICEEEGKMAGFLIYELNAATLYLRYWFTHPEFRDKKVGSGLLRRFFAEGRETKRQLFWVIRTNENAIVRYKHYGFKEENMYDYVMKRGG